MCLSKLSGEITIKLKYYNFQRLLKRNIVHYNKIKFGVATAGNDGLLS